MPSEHAAPQDRNATAVGTGRPIARRDFLKMGTAAAAAAALGAMPGARAMGKSAPPGKRPNILFVFSDEHRWCSMPMTEMADCVAPNMARMAREGTRFDNCVSTSPICVPYRGMLITGMWPHQSSCVSNDTFINGDVIGVDAPTIAHAFKQAGYVTGYVGKWHLKNQTCANAGFDTFKHWLYGDDHLKTQVRDIPSGEDFHTVEGYNATGMTDQAIDFITESARGDKPWLMMLSINPPHFRWDDAPEDCLAHYPEEKISWRPNVTDDRFRTGKRLQDYRHYHGHITAVDRELGRLMAKLEALGIDENTVVIYTSDHGSGWGSNGYCNKAHPYDEAVRVPLLVRWPGRVPAGRVADHNIGTVDLHATLCGLAGAKPLPHCQGLDFSPVFLGREGPDPESQPIMVNNFQRSYYRSVLDPGGHDDVAPFRGVRTKRYTFIFGAQGQWLLFDNQNDPYQMNNLIDDPAHAEVRARLRAELDRWLARAEEPFIPEHWRSLGLAERIALENRHYSLLPHAKRWEKLKADAVAAHLSGASGDQARRIREAADRVFDEDYFGVYMAHHNAVNGRRRWTQRPVEDVQAALDAHQARYAARFKDEVAVILGDAN